MAGVLIKRGNLDTTQTHGKAHVKMEYWREAPLS